MGEDPRREEAVPEDIGEKLGAYQEDIDTLTDEIEALREDRAAVRQEQREYVTEALESVQDGLGADGRFPLIAVAERGRMTFDYEEVLTADGVETSGDGYHDWDGAIGLEEYLDRQYRGTTEHIEKLAERLAGPEDDALPRMQYPIHG